MQSCRQGWKWLCPACGYEASDFVPSINDASVHAKIDESYREIGLRSLRVQNFKKLLRVIKKNGLHSGNLLDVGSAHGWFLEAATVNGFQSLGIEPDLKIYRNSIGRGLNVRFGFFPDVLKADEIFDVIVFNDVFEHIPEPSHVLLMCRNYLKEDGILVLNLPSSAGIFYKISSHFLRFGYSNFHERLWQKGFPSPHLHYFNKKNVQMLLQNNGFKITSVGSLISFKLTGLFTRLSYSSKHAFVGRLVVYTIILMAYPFLLLLPSDIIYVVAMKSKSS